MNAGDRVRLRSGGYCMTFVQALPYGDVQCCWMDVNGTYHIEPFPPATIELDAPAGIVQPGIIVLWYGAPTTIPPGWVNCDGTDGSPDLRTEKPPKGALFIFKK